MRSSPGRHRVHRALDLTLVVGTAAIGVAWFLYFLVGHRIAAHAYTSDSHLAALIMPGRETTPLPAYVDRADALMLTTTCWVLPALALVALRRRLVALVCTVLAFAAVFLAVIVFLEARPSFAYRLGLDAVGYYLVRNTLVPDEDLVYRGKPLLRTSMRESMDTRPFGIESVPIVSEWTTDEEGFRNAHAATSCDVVVIGDGMLTSGRVVSETFGSRLEQHLRRCVANLGISGHGPFQYVRTFERYGIPKQPTYAILAFNEGNDIQDIEKYLAWKAGSPTSFWGGYEIALANPVVRLRVAAGQTLDHLRERAWLYASNAVFAQSGAAHPLASTVAWIELPARAAFPMVFVDRVPTETVTAIQGTENWQRMRTVVTRFLGLCADHRIVPAILFIPTAAHIYAEYSTKRSGREWLRVRDEQIRAKANLENALASLSAERGVPFVSLTVPFEDAAKKGAVLYDSFSVHFTPDGADVAARHVAAAIRASDPS